MMTAAAVAVCGVECSCSVIAWLLCWLDPLRCFYLCQNEYVRVAGASAGKRQAGAGAGSGQRRAAERVGLI
jgi:hypothetical protein